MVYSIVNFHIMTFEEQLYITIIDKLLIGALIVVVGFTFNRLLERFKSKQSFSNEMAKQRVTKISECWEIMYKWEYKIQSIYTLMAHYSDISSSKEEYNRMMKEDDTIKKLVEDINKIFPLVKETVERNRFWTGNDLYKKFVSYGSSLHRCVDAFLNGRWDEFMKTYSIIEKEKEDITTLLAKLKIGS